MEGDIAQGDQAQGDAAVILAVEDNEHSLDLLSTIMTNAGYRVRQAADGEAALSSIRSQLPDLILLDVHMPRLDGFAVCRHLKAHADTEGIPVIFLTASDDPESRVKGLQMGAVDYLAKPYHPVEVLLRVKTHLELRKLQLHLSEQCLLRTRELQEEVNERQRTEQKLIRSRQSLRELAGHLQEVREEERSDIAREIHDELGQTLTVAKIELVHAIDELERHGDPVARRIEHAVAVLEQASDIARNISENLRPGMLDVLGLCPAIEHHVRHYTESTGIHCDCVMSEREESPPPEKVAIAGLRIVQESLTNIAKYARAKSVNIVVQEEASRLYIKVSDNGDGFDITSLAQKRCFGLLGMRERANLLHGDLSIKSEPGCGTTVEATLPY